MDDVTAAAEPQAHDPVTMLHQLYESTPDIEDAPKMISGNITVWRDDGSVKLCVLDAAHRRRDHSIPYAAIYADIAGDVSVELRGYSLRRGSRHHITNATSPRDLLAKAVAWYKHEIQNLPKPDQAHAAAEPPATPNTDAVNALAAIIRRGGAQRALVHGHTFYVRMYGETQLPIVVDLELRSNSPRFTRIRADAETPEYQLVHGIGNTVIAKLPVQGATATSLMRWAVQHTYTYAKQHGWLTGTAEAAVEPPASTHTYPALSALCGSAARRRGGFTVGPFIVAQSSVTAKGGHLSLLLILQASPRAEDAFRVTAGTGCYILRTALGVKVAEVASTGMTAAALLRWAVTHANHYKQSGDMLATSAAEPGTAVASLEALGEALKLVWRKYVIVQMHSGTTLEMTHAYMDVHTKNTLYFGFTKQNPGDRVRARGDYAVRVRGGQYVLDCRDGYNHDLVRSAATTSAPTALPSALAMLQAVAKLETRVTGGMGYEVHLRSTVTPPLHHAEAAVGPHSYAYTALETLLERARAHTGGFDVGAFQVTTSQVPVLTSSLLLQVQEAHDHEKAFRVFGQGQDYILTTIAGHEVARRSVQSTDANTLLRWALVEAAGYGHAHGWIVVAAVEPQNDNHIKMVFERLLRMFPTAMEGEGYKHVTTDIVGWREHNTDMFLAVLGDRTAPKATLHLYRTAPGYAVEVSTGPLHTDPVLDITSASTPADMLQQALSFYRDHLRSRHVQAAAEPAGSRARDLLNKLQVHQGAHSPEQEVAPHLFTGGRVTTKQMQRGVGVTVDVVMDLSTEPHHQGAGTGYWFNVYVDIRMIRGKLIMTEVTFGSYGPHVEADKPGIDVTNMDVRHVLATAQVSAAVFTRKWLPEAIHHYTRDDRRFQALRAATPVTAAAEPPPENMDTSAMHTTLFRYKAEFNVAGETVNVHYVDDFPEHRVSAMYGVYGRHLGLGFVDVHVASGKLHVRTRSLLVGYDKQTNKAYKLPTSLSPDSFHRFLGAVFTKLQSGVFRDWLAHAPAQAAAEPHTGPSIRDSFKELVRGFHQERKVQLPGFHGEVHVRAERTGTSDPTLDALVLQVQDRSYIARWFDAVGFVHISENSVKARDFRKFQKSMTPAELLRQLLVFAVTDYRSHQP